MLLQPQIAESAFNLQLIHEMSQQKIHTNSCLNKVTVIVYKLRQNASTRIVTIYGIH